MTLQEGHAVAGRRRAGPEKTPRLRLKPKAPPTGYVDGAWWPHSDGLPKELPDLLAVLSVRLDAVTHVMYNLDEWAPAPEKLLTCGRVIRLDGSRLQPTNTLEILGINRKQVLLLVIPPHVDPNRAHETMMAAAAPNNASTVDALLRSPGDRQSDSQTADTEKRWTADDKPVA